MLNLMLSFKNNFKKMNEVIDILKKTGAVLDNGHFVGVSGLHFDLYITKDALLPHTEEVSAICKLYAEKYKDVDVDVVAGPALGGIILSQWIAYHLSKLKGKEVLSVYTEKTVDKDQIFTRGNEVYVKGKKVLAVEDVVTTGGSVLKVIKSVQNAGGEVVGVCVMVNKDPDNINSKTFGVPFESLSELKVATYLAEACPFCKKGIPVNTTVGYGKKFVEEQKNK